jgi:hypothetical protein
LAQLTPPFSHLKYLKNLIFFINIIGQEADELYSSLASTIKYRVFITFKGISYPYKISIEKVANGTLVLTANKAFNS